MKILVPFITVIAVIGISIYCVSFVKTYSVMSQSFTTVADYVKTEATQDVVSLHNNWM